MDEIVCANTAFRYWRCPPQVRSLYPRLPNSEDGWRALSQAPFVTDVLKTPILPRRSPVALTTIRDCGQQSIAETFLGWTVHWKQRWALG